MVSKNDYEPFIEALEVDQQFLDYETKEELKYLMQSYGYRYSKKYGKLEPTSKQVNYAWDYLKGKQPQQVLERYIDFVENKYTKHEVIRAERGLSFEGKRYRKGQFLPKGVR